VFFQTFAVRLKRIAPQLRALSLSVSVDPSSPDLLSQLPTTFWSTFQHLQRLTIDFDCPWILEHLPSALQHLRLRPITRSSCSLLSLINVSTEGPPSLAEIETITLPLDSPCNTSPWSSSISPEELVEHEAERASLRVICEERGIELVEKKNSDKSSELASLEDAMDVW
jgi:hypothetical protein